MENVIKKKGDKLYVKWKGYDNSFNSWIEKKKRCYIKMSQCFSKSYEAFGEDIDVKVDLSNYATKADLKNATDVDASSSAKKIDLTSLKSNADKLNIDKLKNVPTNVSNLKRKVEELDIDKLAPVSVFFLFADLSKLSNVLKNDAVKKDVYNARIKNIEDKIIDITNLATKTTLNVKINEVKGEVSSITNLATTTALTAVENKIPDVSNLVKKN